MVSPAKKRAVVAQVMRDHGVSQRWAIKTLGVSRSVVRYQPSQQRVDADVALTAAVREMCGRRRMRRYGYRRITTALRNAGWAVNEKRVRRIMKAEGLLRPRKKRPPRAKGLSSNSITLLAPQHCNHVWSYDFVKVRLADGTGLRMLSIIDEHPRFALPPLIAEHITAEDVADHLAKLFGLYGIPTLMRSDNGPEFVANHLVSWLARLDVGCAFIKPASPWENAYVETWHDKLRDELLNEELLITPQEAKIVIGDWIDHFNHDRPHSGLANRTPAQVRYAAEHTPTLTSVDQEPG